ncbi:glycoside hydrolase family 108 protein [Edwardsiella tarda]|uniref:glycoside hydrolase family 108 protein n=1 Tax=Edwardsiella tarda TaxID=636 RepID=UPI000559541E|nr:glycosyl hydrolase 108 family protein [Edwardsiella tarda]
MTLFDVVFERVVGHEGGYQTDPRDRGNWTGGAVNKGQLKGTKFGLAAMTYPDLDIKNLTPEQAKAIYQRDWWSKFGMERFPQALAYQMFDAAVNHGIGRANQFLQRAVSVNDDGKVGPATLSALNSADLNDVLMLFLAERLQYFTEVKTWKDYCTGWTRRVVQNLRYATQDN